MLGVYNNFPQNIHNAAAYVTSASSQRVQRTLLETFIKLNNQTLKPDGICIPPTPDCKLIIEFGVAQGNSFTFLDSQEKDGLLKAAKREPLKILDILCVVRYYKIRNEKTTPLKFDYYILRFKFNSNTLEMYVFHERGPMHVTPKDIPRFLADKINENFRRKILKINSL